MQFTDKLIKNLKPRTTAYDVREKTGEGFTIRVMPSGCKSWIFFYHADGKKRRMTLGKYPALGLADARQLHRSALATLASGKDPALLQQLERTQARTAQTLGELATEYLEKWAKPRKRSWAEDERILNKDVLPLWRQRKAKDITRKDVLALLDAIHKRGAPIAANRTLAVIRRMFNFALERDIVENSPCYAIKAPAKENRRDRVLTEQEIQFFWHGLPETSMAPLPQLALKFQLATAQRKGEVVIAEWAEIDLQTGWWIIPASKAKNGLPHRVPLSALALNLLEQLHALTGHSRWLFPSPNSDQSYGVTAIDHTLRKNFKHLPEMPTFTPHDLRRTAASHMTSLGLSRLVVSKILNHAESSVTAIYDRHSYDKEKQEALALWADQLQKIIGLAII